MTYSMIYLSSRFSKMTAYIFMINFLIGLLMLSMTGTTNVSAADFSKQYTLSQDNFSLEKRYDSTFVNDVFKENILLTLKYLNGDVKNSGDIKWNDIEKPFSFEFALKPGEVFAFHDDVLPEYQGKVVKETNTHFNLADGFKSDGYLVGDGVCHLASLMNLAAQKAGLEVKAPTSHNFANIPQVPKEYGTSIYYYPGQHSNNAIQNLYIKNNKNNEIAFKFDYDGKNLKISVVELKTTL